MTTSEIADRSYACCPKNALTSSNCPLTWKLAGILGRQLHTGQDYMVYAMMLQFLLAELRLTRRFPSWTGYLRMLY